MQGLVKLNMKGLCGSQIRKDINKSYHCKLKIWMEAEYDENVIKFWTSSMEILLINLKKMMVYMMIVISNILCRLIWEHLI